MGIARLVVLVSALVFTFASSSLAQSIPANLSNFHEKYGDHKILTSFYAGYFVNDVSFGGSQDDPLVGRDEFIGETIYSYWASDVKYRHQGLALGLSAQTASDYVISDILGPIGFSLSGWVNLPVNTDDASQVWARSIGPLASGVSLPARAEWDVDATWWWIDALTSFEMSRNLDFLMGLRYESYSVNFFNPRSPTPELQYPFGPGGFGVYVPFHSENDDFSSSVYGLYPYLGLKVKYNSPTVNFGLSLAGLPYMVGGNIEFQETIGDIPIRLDASGRSNSGFRFYTLLEYSHKWGSAWTVGAFARWDGSQMDIYKEMDELNFVTYEPILGGNIVGSGAGGGGDASMVNNSLTIGANFSMDFRLPEIL